jgi:hypothetical protein
MQYISYKIPFIDSKKNNQIQQITLINHFIIKPTRYTNFPNLLRHETVHVEFHAGVNLGNWYVLLVSLERNVKSTRSASRHTHGNNTCIGLKVIYYVNGTKGFPLP